MQRASVHRPAGEWPQDRAVGTVTLDFDARHRRRVRLETGVVGDVLLDLPTAVAMADGDGLQLQDGSWLRVGAAPEPVVNVRHVDPHRLLRLAWHLGNRHLPTEFRGDGLRIRPDHVIEAMLARFGAQLTPASEPFQPEGGAYAPGEDAERHMHDRG